MIRIGACTVEIHPGWTETRFPDGRSVTALHTAQPGQDGTARRCGYRSAEELNRDYDLTHSLLAAWLGLPWSPTLYDVARGISGDELHAIEEEAVLAVQRLANALKVDL